MGLVTPADPVPVGELGRVHFTGIGGAGMSGIARILLARGVPVSGSDSAAIAAAGPAGRARRARSRVGHDGGQSRATQTRWWCPPRSGRTTRSWSRPGGAAPGSAPGRGAGVGDARPPRYRRRRDARQDDDHVDADHRSCAGAGADPSYVIGGILAETGLGAARRQRRRVRRRGRRERRLVPHAGARAAAVVTCVEADHLDNYADAGGDRGGVRRPSPAGYRPAGCWSPARTTRARGRSPAAASGLRSCGCARTASAPDADYRVSDVTPDGMTTALTVTPGPRRGHAGRRRAGRSRSPCPAGTMR